MLMKCMLILFWQHLKMLVFTPPSTFVPKLVPKSSKLVTSGHCKIIRENPKRYVTEALLVVEI